MRLINFQNILYTSFEGLYQARFGLEYPPRQEVFHKCKTNNDKPCLKSYYRVVDAKKKIENLPADKTLVNTLDIIEHSCVSEDEYLANFICYGGLMSLYLHNTSEQDMKIFSRITKYQKKIQSLIFNYHFYWVHNRPKNSKWSNYLLKADINWKDDYQKQFIIAEFKKSINDIKGEPWPLRKPD